MTSVDHQTIIVVVCDSNGDSDCGASDGTLAGRLSRVVLSFITAAYPGPNRAKRRVGEPYRYTWAAASR
jgi:hypothetical protein